MPVTKWRRICLAAFTAILVASALALVIRQLNAMAIHRVREQREALEKQLNTHVDLGMDSRQIVSYLESRSIEHAPYMRVGESKVLSSFYGAPGVIEASVPIHTFSPVKYSIHLVFKFDAEGHFTGYTDKVEGTFY